ncbi:MAG: hypothetical protein ACFE78_05330, partial [Candidatus Hodarchaeota archaeon]
MKDNNYNDKIVGNNQINNEEEKSNDASETNNESIKEELTISLTNEKLNEVTIESELEQEKLSQDSEYAAQIELAELNKNLIEGALYASGRPLDIEELSTKLEIPKKEVEELVHQIAFDYLER